MLTLDERPARVSLSTLAVLQALAAHVETHGYPPTLRELGDALGLKAASAVKYHLGKLADAGLVTVAPMLSRGATVTPDGYRLLGTTPPAGIGAPRLTVTNAVLGRELRRLARHDGHAALVLAALEVAS